MKKPNLRAMFSALFLITALSAMMVSSVSSDEKSVSNVINDAWEQHIWGNFDEGIALVEDLFERTNLSPADSIAAFEMLGIIYNCKGDEFKKTAVGYLKKISKVGPCYIELPGSKWPIELRKEWYKLTYAAKTFTCEQDEEVTVQYINSESGKTESKKVKLRTIAVPLPFENTSIGDYQKSLGGLGTGLSQNFLVDFNKISSLKIVERDKIDFLIKELDLAKSGVVDQASAIEAGKILSAHLMVFGGFTQIDKDNTMMVVRIVNVETSEVIAVIKHQGGSNYFEMEKELVAKICDELDLYMSEEDRKELQLGGTSSPEAARYYSAGLESEIGEKYGEAFQNFKKAYDLDNDFAEAKQKMEVYRPLST
ncbi:MAG: CsgG/HfaB family protein [candidate division Zixibacteria bacterium]